MQAIKALVISMGVLLIAGLGLLGYGMYSKGGSSVKPSPAVSAKPATSIVAAGAAMSSDVTEPFGELGLDQPPGTRIAATRLEGNILVVELTEGGHPDRLAVIDLGQGRLLGTVSLGASQAVDDAPPAR